jgi:hypothetical protein
VRLLEVVRSKRDGRVGTIVEHHVDARFEVEFVDDTGYTESIETLAEGDLEECDPACDFETEAGRQAIRERLLRVAEGDQELADRLFADEEARARSFL